MVRRVRELVEELAWEYPELRFREGRKFAWRPPRTIIYAEDGEEGGALRLLHEVGHARLGHRDYVTDAERVKMERAAWEEVRGLAARYGVEFDEELAEAELDTYRDWMYQRSKCPRCGLTRFQKADGEYVCPGCSGG